MSAAEMPEVTAEVQRQLDLANSQLALYARDLKRIVDAERHKAHALAQANARLHILDRLKTDFLLFISHALRTPLNAMVAIDMLDPHSNAEEQDLLIDCIRTGHKHLEGLVMKGLEYFQWLGSKRTDTPEITDLTVIVPLAIEHSAARVDATVDIQLSCPDTPCLVRGEEQHLMHVMQILLSNARKFSSEANVVRVDIRTTAETVTLAVTDHGRGFPPELAQELFQPCTIADVKHHSQGTGLNLAIAQAIVEAYGGSLRAESEGISKGATFSVAFPALSLSEETMKEIVYDGKNLVRR